MSPSTGTRQLGIHRKQPVRILVPNPYPAHEPMGTLIPSLRKGIMKLTMKNFQGNEILFFFALYFVIIQNLPLRFNIDENLPSESC